MADVVSFQGPDPEPRLDRPAPSERVRGNPERRTFSRFVDPYRRFFAGTWESDVGAWELDVAENQQELCTILAGKVRLTDLAGASVTFGPGDSFVVPGGFVGVWETLERVRTTFAVAVLRP